MDLVQGHLTNDKLVNGLKTEETEHKHSSRSWAYFQYWFLFCPVWPSSNISFGQKIFDYPNICLSLRQFSENILPLNRRLFPGIPQLNLLCTFILVRKKLNIQILVTVWDSFWKYSILFPFFALLDLLFIFKYPNNCHSLRQFLKIFNIVSLCCPVGPATLI